MTYSHLIFSGDTPLTLNESIRISSSYTGIKKIVIVIPEERSFTFEDVQKNIPQIWNPEQIEIQEAPANDVIQCELKILEILKREKTHDNKTIINVTNSLPVFIIAGYFCASASRSEIIMGLNEKTVVIPRVPFCKLIPARYEILFAIPDDEAGIESQDELVKQLNTGQPKDYKKSNVSNNLEILENRKYITREWKGKVRSIKLTDLGRVIKAGHELLSTEKSRESQ